jgi:hypothetical protein
MLAELPELLALVHPHPLPGARAVSGIVAAIDALSYDAFQSLCLHGEHRSRRLASNTGDSQSARPASPAPAHAARPGGTSTCCSSASIWSPVGCGFPIQRAPHWPRLPSIFAGSIWWRLPRCQTGPNLGLVSPSDRPQVRRLEAPVPIRDAHGLIL